MSPAHRRSALLMLGDLMERRLNSEPDAVSAYRQIISEYPDSPETELARLRLRLMKDEL